MSVGGGPFKREQLVVGPGGWPSSSSQRESREGGYLLLIRKPRTGAKCGPSLNVTESRPEASESDVYSQTTMTFRTGIRK